MTVKTRRFFKFCRSCINCMCVSNNKANYRLLPKYVHKNKTKEDFNFILFKPVESHNRALGNILAGLPNEENF